MQTVSEECGLPRSQEDVLGEPPRLPQGHRSGSGPRAGQPRLRTTQSFVSFIATPFLPFGSLVYFLAQSSDDGGIQRSKTPEMTPVVNLMMPTPRQESSCVS